MKIFCSANQKGGTGKTTISVHVAYSAAESGLRVLLVDGDEDGNLSFTFPQRDLKKTYRKTSSLFGLSDSSTEIEVVRENISFIRADPLLKDISELTTHPKQELERLSANFDLCVIDTPPHVGAVLASLLIASTDVITPMPVGAYEMHGVGKLFDTIKAIKKTYNRNLNHAGIILVKTNSRSKEEREAISTLREQYGSAILEGTLPERAAVKAATARRKPVWENVKGSSHKQAAIEWRSVCQNIVNGVMNK